MCDVSACFGIQRRSFPDIYWLAQRCIFFSFNSSNIWDKGFWRYVQKMLLIIAIKIKSTPAFVNAAAQFKLGNMHIYIMLGWHVAEKVGLILNKSVQICAPCTGTPCVFVLRAGKHMLAVFVYVHVRPTSLCSYSIRVFAHVSVGG